MQPAMYGYDDDDDDDDGNNACALDDRITRMIPRWFDSVFHTHITNCTIIRSQLAYLQWIRKQLPYILD